MTDRCNLAGKCRIAKTLRRLMPYVMGCFAGALLGVCGCNTEMESGYKPRSLNAGPAQRRAYYASPFTAEAEAGKQEKGGPSMRPAGGGY
jgi:hypothetical protein